jgi:hypothetical protein
MWPIISLFDVVNANEVVCNGDGGPYERRSAGSQEPLPECPGASPELVERGPYAYNKVYPTSAQWPPPLFPFFFSRMRLQFFSLTRTALQLSHISILLALNYNSTYLLTLCFTSAHRYI